MTRVAIVPVAADEGSFHFCALSGDKQSQGRTAGEALDALTTQLPDNETGTLIILQRFRPDPFFGAAQKQRMAELMVRWRTARDQGRAIDAEEQTELDALIEAELLASTDRAAALADEAGQ